MSSRKRNGIKPIVCLLLFVAAAGTDMTAPENNGETPYLPLFPIFGFGNTILKKNELIIGQGLYNFQFERGRATFLLPALLYGITDSLSLSLYASIASNEQEGGCRDISSFGISNTSIVGEYAFFKKKHSTTDIEYRATLYCNLGLPVPDQKIPPLGYESTTFLLGTAGKISTQSWRVFSFLGALLPTKANRTEYGKQFFYEIGCGVSLKHTKTFSAIMLLECDGRFMQQDTTGPMLDPDSGGSIVLVGPGIVLRHGRFVFDGAFQAPVFQSLNGKQEKRLYRFAFQIFWIF